MIKIGIFFGGPSREREIAFAGGRTVYDNLNKSLFKPVPIFVDSLRNFILLDWEYIYKGTIRDFFPPVSVLPESRNHFQVYLESLGKLSDKEMNEIIAKVGRKVNISELSKLIDVAFLALHGSYGEDGQIQGLFESLKIPYTGSGIRACAIGIDKAFQKKIMDAAGFPCPKVMVLDRKAWENGNTESIYQNAIETVGFPIVIRPANQGSSIGVSIVGKDKGLEGFSNAINNAFFRTILTNTFWNNQTKAEKVQYIRDLTDIRDGLGFPLDVNDKTIYHPEKLLKYLNAYFEDGETAVLSSHLSEQRVIIEQFIEGREFSCIVVRKEDGSAAALPPTEIVKGKEVFDYRSKYLPGLSRKVTPIDLPDAAINKIRSECERLFHYLEFNTYARIDGFFANDGTIFLNDPNTTSGMLPSSFFFHQAAEIGLNPSQFLTYIIRASLQERIATALDKTRYGKTMRKLDKSIASLQSEAISKQKIAVILGGYSFERHISVESGRNVFEKLSSSEKYEPIPVFLMKTEEGHSLYQLPINLLLKDNADDISDKILNFKKHPIVEEIKAELKDITQKYASQDVVFEPKKLSYEDLKTMVSGVFIALHGRPGEDGNVQSILEKLHIPYNGSDSKSSSITIDKYETLQTLKKAGMSVTEQFLTYKSDFTIAAESTMRAIESRFRYPFIVKPVDDGCSSAVKILRNREQLEAFLQCMYRDSEDISETLRSILKLKPKEEFPRKDCVLVESLITANGAKHFLEITGGLMTRYKDDGRIKYEVFEPSEALAGGEVLSLEEKFLAGEGQNITPARFATDAGAYQKIAAQVKADLEKVARILNVQGYARIDAFVRIFENNHAETIVIEVNSLPGMTPATCIFHQTAINGYKPYDFIDNILEFGKERNLRNQ